MTPNTTALYRRIVRRETHSPRSGAATTVAVVLILLLVWIGVESVLAVAGVAPLLADPRTMVAAIASLPDSVAPPFLVTAGTVLAVLGLVLVVLAVAPGRRARHAASAGRTAFVADDRAIASSLARIASRTARVDPDQVVVSIGRRRATVDVRPTSGFPVDSAAVQTAVDAALASYTLSPTIHASIRVAREGTVGA
jgi:hypothetical protein